MIPGGSSQVASNVSGAAGDKAMESLGVIGDALMESSTMGISAVNLSNSTAGEPDAATCYAFEFYLYTVAMGLLGVLGLVGNSLSFLVLRKDRGTPVATFLLQVLAVADNCFLLIWLVSYSVKNYLRFMEPATATGPAWLYTRVYTFPLLYIAQMETIWLTVVIALNRYMAVCMPYKAPHLCTVYNVYKEVVVVTLFSVCMNIPRFFEIDVVRRRQNGTVVVEWERTELGKNPIYATVYTDALYYLFSFVLPLLILAFVNMRVTAAYQAAKRRKRRMTTRRSVDNENNITLVMIVIVVVFMLCQAPARIVQLVWSYKYSHCYEYQYYFIHVSNTLEVLNSSVNFLIYFSFRQRFRDIIVENFCCGPVVSSHRRDSAKATTTEGLSLAQFEQTNTRCNSIREASCRRNHGGEILEANAADLEVHDCDKEPLNGTYRPREASVQSQDGQDPTEDAMFL